MNLKEAKEIFEDIVDLCNKIEDANITDAIDSIYTDAKEAETVFDLIEFITELIFYVDELSWSDEELFSIKEEIQILYIKIQDEAE